MKTETNVIFNLRFVGSRQDMNMNLIKQRITAMAHHGHVPTTPLCALCQGYTWNVSSPSPTVLIKVNLLELILEGGMTSR